MWRLLRNQENDILFYNYKLTARVGKTEKDDWIVVVVDCHEGTVYYKDGMSEVEALKKLFEVLRIYE